MQKSGGLCVLFLHKRHGYELMLGSLYSRENGRKMDLLAFRTYVTTTYLQSYAVPPSPGVKRKTTKQANQTTDAVRYDGLNHWIERTTSRLVCAVCKSRPITRCEKCKVGLCLECFKSYHIRK